MAFISIPTSIDGVNIPGQMGKIASGPLSLLFNGKGVSTLKYPLDLGTDATRLHYVSFSISEIVPSDWAGGVASSVSLKLPGLESILPAVSSAASEFSGFIPKLNETVTIPYAAPTTAGINNKSINDAVTKGFSNIGNAFNKIGDFAKEGLTINPKLKKLGAVISLYMPDTINATYNAHYNEMSMTGDLGDKITSLRQITSLAGRYVAAGPDGKIPGGAEGVVGRILNSISSDPETVSLAARLTGMENLGDLINKGRGYAFNPQLQMIYKGLDLREFQLTFTFTPKSAQESKEVDNIISMFKLHYAPRLQAGIETVNSMFLIPPSIFNIKFMHDNSENTHLPKYGDCVLVNIDVNYTPNGFAAYEDGSPIQSMLMLQFKEVEAIDRGKLEKGTHR